MTLRRATHASPAHRAHARDGVRHDERRKFPSRKDVWTDRDLLIRETDGDTIIHSFVAAAEKNQAMISSRRRASAW